MQQKKVYNFILLNMFDVPKFVPNRIQTSSALTFFLFFCYNKPSEIDLIWSIWLKDNNWSQFTKTESGCFNCVKKWDKLH